MENNSTSLVPQQPLFPILEKQEKQLAIVDNLLAESVRKKILNIAINHPVFFIQMISRNYPLTHSLIEKYEDKWDWYRLSLNTALTWSMELIEKYEYKWSWDFGLSGTESVYQKVFKPHLTDSFVDEIMNKI